MKNIKIKAISLIAGASLVATLGLTACGGNNNASSDKGSDQAPAAQTEETSAAVEKGAEAGDTSAASSQLIEVSKMNAWVGLNEAGDTFYYAESPEGTEGVMVVMDIEGNYLSFVGQVERPKESYVKITDMTTGNSLTFEVVEADKDGNVAIDMGDQGKAVLAKCDAADVLEILGVIDAYGNAIA